MKYDKKIDWYLSKSLKSSDAIDFIKLKLEEEPFDIFNYIVYADRPYSIENQGIKIDYDIDLSRNRDVHINVEQNSKSKTKNMVLDIKKAGNLFNIIEKDLKEDTYIYQVLHNIDSTVDVSSRKVRFYETNKEYDIESTFLKISPTGNILDYKEYKADHTPNNIYKKK